ncbi:MAG: prephenate dehydrogenase [Chloroflexi bacterium]|nr:prephenate dehydrogenase [Chloroflexota bacterium]
MSFRIAIVGLGRLGGSIGLALKSLKAPSKGSLKAPSKGDAGAELEIVGHDKDNEAAKRALKAGCVDRTEWNLINACDGADLVVVSTPLAAIRGTLAAIGRELKPGCVVTDTGSLKVPVLTWARESLPDTVHFVGGHPIVAATQSGAAGAERLPATADTPSASLLSRAIYCLIPGTHTPPRALQRVSDLVEAVGAKPYYLDAAEHDGLIAALEQVPLLAALALQAMASASPSRREMVRLSGSSFADSTQLLVGDAETLGSLCVLNGENVARWLDAYMGELARLRELIAHGNSEELHKAVTSAMEARADWTRGRPEGEDTDYSDFDMTHKMLGGLFRPPKEKGK